MPEEQRQIQQVQPERQPAIIFHPPGEIHLYQVTEETLDELADSGIGKSVNALFATTLFGALLTLIIWLFTGEFSNPSASASAIAASIVVGVLFLYFGVRAILDYFRARRLLRRVKGHARR